MLAERLHRLQVNLNEAEIDVALIMDDDSIYYITGFYDYLHMDFGRPTILAAPREGDTLLITPGMEMEMAEAAARVDFHCFKPGFDRTFWIGEIVDPDQAAVYEVAVEANGQRSRC